jgi:transcriptional regulator GlxA family with amidase domain
VDQHRLADLCFAEIAERCGYSDAGAFRKVFRARIGMSPKAYRERFSLRRS